MREPTSRAARGAEAILVAALALGLGCAARVPAPPAGGRGALRVANAGRLDPDLERGLRAMARADSLWPPEGLLAALADRGYLAASVCREADGTWTLHPGARADSIPLAWARADGASEGPIPGAVRSLSTRDGPVAERLDGIALGVLARCAETGHPLAVLSVSDVAASDSSAALGLALDPGPRVRVTGLEFRGCRSTRPSYLRRVAGWRGPEVYRDRRLRATGLFRRVEGPWLVLGGRAGAALGETLDAPLAFRLTERPVNRLSGLLGYSDRPGSAGGGGKLGGFVDLTLGNLFGTGRAAHALWQGEGGGRSRLELDWREPYVWKLPLAADLALRHVQEDTLYAQIGWEALLAWSPGLDWRVALGVGGSRLTLGGVAGRTEDRDLTLFSVRRAPPAPDRWRADWGAQLEGSRARGADELLTLQLTLREQWAVGGWGMRLEQQGGSVTGADSLLRSDMLRVGGANSLRGSLEGEHLARALVLQRGELGRRLDREGSRAYVLADLAWIRRWSPSVDGLYGAAAGWEFLAAGGVGLELPSPAGWVRLEFVVPRGEELARGRVHLGLDGTF
jgi:outer membrane protein insertion porin family